jgi:3-phosphoshikimate 1-carboxyvinyltransferase
VTTWNLAPAGALRGELRVPGDKSISHRALIFGSLARGPSRVKGLLGSEDVAATASAVQAFGARLEERGDHLLLTPPSHLKEPQDVVDCGNSGTSIRLLCGLAAAQPFFTVLTGDDSLRKRPMRRVVTPLRAMGARIEGREDSRLPPLAIQGGSLRSHRHDLSIASAQVKSCLLLAGLRTGIAVREPRTSRDHSERMLRAMGASLVSGPERWLELAATEGLDPVDVEVPADLSAAAFWLVAGCIVPGSALRLPAVGVNPTRSGVIDALRAMGADLQVEAVSSDGPEPCANLHVRAGTLRGARIDGELALRCLDELPVLAVAAACAQGTTVIADAAELRVKESDRIARVVAGLRALGAQVEERPDGMVIEGGPLPGGGTVNAQGDHRIAMAFAIAGLVAPAGVTVTGADSVASSYPQFRAHLESLLG